MEKIVSATITLALALTLLTSCDSMFGDKTVTMLLSQDLKDNVKHADFLQNFEKAHKGAKVELVYFDVKDFFPGAQTGVADKLRTEIMSGKGPDLIYLSAQELSYLFPDIIKTMQAGAFVDLNKYMRDSVLTNKAEYYTEVFEAGQLEDKQYILPMSFDFLSIAADSALVKSANISKDDTASRMIEKLLPLCNEENAYIRLADLHTAGSDSVMDYDNKKLRFTAEYEACMALEKIVWPYAASPISHEQTAPHSVCIGNSSRFNSALQCATARLMDNKPTDFIALPNEGGGVTAIVNTAIMLVAGSDNKALAAQLIEGLFSDELQGIHHDDKDFYFGDRFAFPVRKVMFDYVYDNVLSMQQNKSEALRATTIEILDKISSARFGTVDGVEDRISGRVLMSKESFADTKAKLEYEYRYYFDE